ncbi:MAG: M23 family metallopeptidase [Deltaproteobacteria bacterium]
MEKYYKNRAFIGYGEILFASYHLIEENKTYEAYSFEYNHKAGYFNARGEELGTPFLRSPVPIGRVTSRFTFHRKHPITGVIRPHLGVDLAAPIGTPIMAAADGKVIFAGRRGGFGNQVILQHGNGYKTYYGHLSRFAKGIRRGAAVTQKKIIGYVGSTGLSTGPHLDYRLQENGVFKNPFAVKFKPRSILTGQVLRSFQDTVVRRYDRYLADYKGNRHLIEAKKITVDDTLPKILL